MNYCPTPRYLEPSHFIYSTGTLYLLCARHYSRLTRHISESNRQRVCLHGGCTSVGEDRQTSKSWIICETGALQTFLQESHSSVSTGDWFQDCSQIPKPEDAQAPCIKWCSTADGLCILWLLGCLNLGRCRPVSAKVWGLIVLRILRLQVILSLLQQLNCGVVAKGSHIWTMFVVVFQ